MNLYVSFFKETDLQRKKYFLAGDYLEPIKTVFPDLMKLNDAMLDNCIAYIIDKNCADKNAYALDIKNLKVDENTLSFSFDILNELDNISNSSISKALFKFAHRSHWINKDTGYFPLLCLMEKTDFDMVRKGTPNVRKMSNNTAKIEELKGANNWQGICTIYEPVEKANENNELWNNVDDLYNLAFACSKLGEPQNGREKDRKHLENVRRYRDLSISFYTRCTELEPTDFRYASAMAYRYYSNVLELTKPKGRRDGKLIDEINNALKWLNNALELNPNSIKDNYRKGKLIIDKQINNFTYSPHEWTKEWYEELHKIENDGINSLKRVIELYEILKEERFQKIYRNEYIRSLYSLGCFYIENPNIHWNEYICYKINGQTFDISFSREDMQYIADGKELLEKCFAAETEISFDEELDVLKLIKMTNEWAVSPMDKMYRLGLVYLKMYYVKTVLKSDLDRSEQYRQNAEKYLLTAKKIGNEMRRTGLGKRDDWFISEKIAELYIISDKFDKAILTTERAGASYIKNTYAIALLLSGSKEDLAKAKETLKYAANDKYNKAKNMSVVLLAYIYSKQDDPSELKELALKENELFNGSSKKFLSILQIKEDLI